MSKVLVVTYSFTGTGRRLVQMLGGMRNWQQGVITEARPRTGSWVTLRCMLDSFLRRRPSIRYDGPPPEEFDAVVLVAPIWMYQLASPMRAFVSAYRGKLRDVAVISVMGGRGAPNAVAEIGKILGRSPIMSTAFTAREVDNGSCAARLMAFAQAVQQAEDSTLVVRPAEWSPQAN